VFSKAVDSSCLWFRVLNVADRNDPSMLVSLLIIGLALSLVNLTNFMPNIGNLSHVAFTLFMTAIYPILSLCCFRYWWNNPNRVQFPRPVGSAVWLFKITVGFILNAADC